MNARLLAKVLVAVCISHTCLFVMVMADSEEMDLGRVLLMIKYLSAERTQRCGRSLLETIRLTCEFYDRYLAKVPDFATYLRYLSDLEREKYGEDVLAANFGIVERCCKQSCSYITIVDYCLPREMDMDNKRSV